MECGPAKSSKRIKHLKIEREITSSRVLAHVPQNWHANYVEEKKTGKNGEAPRKLNCARANCTGPWTGSIETGSPLSGRVSTDRVWPYSGATATTAYNNSIIILIPILSACTAV
ncbi:hypothetical protein QTP88_014246 [Uroleucon formosanum]